MSNTKYNPEQPFSPGFIVTLGKAANPAIVFGGKRWTARGYHPTLGVPALLLTIDLASNEFANVDPKLPAIELPLFGYINLEGMIEIQEYLIDYENREVIFSEVGNRVDLLPIEDRLPIPLPSVTLSLRKMRQEEIPDDEESYWAAIETFLGGHSFIRVFGKPLFADVCVQAGAEFSYIASIGYELLDEPSGLLDDEAFYLGELAHYFFVSSDWSRIKVISQAS